MKHLIALLLVQLCHAQSLGISHIPTVNTGYSSRYGGPPATTVGQCGYSRVNIGGVCVYDTNVKWCHDQQIRLDDSCDGQCLEERQQVLVDGYCLRKSIAWWCHGQQIWFRHLCDGKCREDLFLVDDRCLKNEELCWAGRWCMTECILPSQPCNDQCPYGMVLHNNRCVLAADTHKCGLEVRMIEEPCDGRCLSGLVNIAGKCVPSNETLECHGILQEARVPCDGKCPVTKNRQFKESIQGDYLTDYARPLYDDYQSSHYDDYAIPLNDDYATDNKQSPVSVTEEYLTDYVMCGDKCLLRSEAWECDGECQHHSVPCRGRCLRVDCFEWKYENYKGTCGKVPEDVLCVGLGLLPIFASSLGGVSTSQLGSRTSGLSECPQTHCRRGSKCCQLVSLGGNTGKNLRCPKIC